jgi:hypothetical protein
MNKFNAVKVTQGGRTFASKKEAKRFAELQLLERAGQIRNLEWQPVFPLIVNNVLVCKYIGDAVYFEGNKRVVEDTKSQPTKTPVYRLKRKLLMALFPGLDHREV